MKTKRKEKSKFSIILLPLKNLSFKKYSCLTNAKSTTSLQSTNPQNPFKGEKILKIYIQFQTLYIIPFSIL